MMSSSKSPKLPLWIFFLTDAILLLTAWFIASRSHGPLSSAAIYSVTACVIAGAIIGTVPMILHYEREKNETLDDRQRALEALALTLTTSAEQISIAAQGLNGIAELAQKNLKQAEQLPQKLQEKIAEFQSQIAGDRDEERNELKKELATLRAAESQSLSATAEKIQRAATELGKLETATQKALTSAQAALAKTPETITAATSSALAEIEAKLAARTAATLAALAAAEASRANAPAADAPTSTDQPGPPGGVERRKSPRRATDVGRHILPVVPPTSAPFTGNIISVSPAPTEPTPEPATAAAPVVEATSPPEPEVKKSEPAPTPVAEAAPAVESPVSAAVTATAEPPAATEAPVVKKRAPRKPKPAESTDGALDLGIVEQPNEFSQVAPSEPAEKVISSDGATRLLVTAYIGIGNRLFIRGEGPGLSWEKGVPLQFVSIGKWRWESAEAAAPVKYKLYKNDEVECITLGAQSLDTGHQQEVTATF